MEADVSRCEPGCPYFLALPAAQLWTRATLEWLLAELDDEEVQANPLLAPFYRAQMTDHARTFELLRAEYSADARVRKHLTPDLLELIDKPLVRV